MLRLTDIERDHLELMAEGLQSNEAAVELGVQPETVKTHRKRILLKLGARNAPHAVALAYHHGLLIPMRVL